MVTSAYLRSRILVLLDGVFCHPERAAFVILNGVKDLKQHLGLCPVFPLQIPRFASE